MNLADYLSNLLEEVSPVSVPGLGVFTREHMSAAYSESDARFYPPYHKIHFAAKQETNDTLTAYVAREKNISLASSKYFAEKFVNQLYEDVAAGKQLFSNLGSFQLINNQLVFEPNKELPNDPRFYGLPATDIIRLSGTASAPSSAPVKIQPVALPPVPENVAVKSPPVYIKEKAKSKSSYTLWIIILAVLLALGVALYAVSQLYPGLFNNYTHGSKPLVAHKAVPPPPPEVRRDTVKYTSATPPPANDKLSQNTASAAAATDSVPVTHFEVIIARYQKNQTKQAADGLKHLQSKGIDAKIAQNTIGPMIKISAGTFDNQKAADSMMAVLINTRKIKRSGSTYILKVNPKK